MKKKAKHEDAKEDKAMIEGMLAKKFGKGKKSKGKASAKRARK